MFHLLKKILALSPAIAVQTKVHGLIYLKILSLVWPFWYRLKSTIHPSIIHTRTYATTLSSSPAVRLAVVVAVGHPLATVVAGHLLAAVRSPPTTYVVGRTARHLHRPQAATRRRCSSTSPLHAYGRKAKARLEFMATSLLPCWRVPVASYVSNNSGVIRRSIWHILFGLTGSSILCWYKPRLN